MRNRLMLKVFTPMAHLLIVLPLFSQKLEVEGKAKVTSMDTVTDVSANVVRQPDGTLALRQYKIRDMAQGGIIFFVDESGEHGLVADTTDLSISMRWFAQAMPVKPTQAKGDGPFAGEMNTAIIISAYVAIGDDGLAYAAKLCAEVQKGGYGDWYLPSKGELNLIYSNLHMAGLGGFAGENYWSATEIDKSNAWSQDFSDGTQNMEDKGNNHHVRAVRAF